MCSSTPVSVAHILPELGLPCPTARSPTDVQSTGVLTSYSGSRAFPVGPATIPPVWANSHVALAPRAGPVAREWKALPTHLLPAFPPAPRALLTERSKAYPVNDTRGPGWHHRPAWAASRRAEGPSQPGQGPICTRAPPPGSEDLAQSKLSYIPFFSLDHNHPGAKIRRTRPVFPALTSPM